MRLTFFLHNIDRGLTLRHSGACGNVNPDNSSIVAMDWQMYGNMNRVSKYCGLTVQITRVSNGKVINATVADACPSCENEHSLDLSIGAFTQLGTKREGMFEIEWEFV